MAGYELVYSGEDSPNGKVWRITLLSDQSGLRIEYGTVGAKQLRSTFVPVARCEDRQCINEMENRVSKKVTEGYVITRRGLDSAPPLSSSAERTDKPGHKVLAYVSYRALSSMELEQVSTQVGDHLTEIVEAASSGSPGGTLGKDESGRWRLRGSLVGQSTLVDEPIYVGVGQTISQHQRALGLVMASLAKQFPTLVSLADADGNELSARDLGERIIPDVDVLEQYGIVRSLNLGDAQPLGEWFF